MLEPLWFILSGGFLAGFAASVGQQWQGNVLFVWFGCFLVLAAPFLGVAL